MSFSCSNSIDGFTFSREKIAAAIERRGLLTMEIEFSRDCNFRCPYCYNSSPEKQGAPSLDSSEIDSVLEQAKQAGAEKIIILGGEPMIYPEIRNKIESIRRLGMAVEMFTNGSCMTEGNARFMRDNQVSVVLKINSFKPELQNRMTGRRDAYDIIWSAFTNLQAAGYPGPECRLAASTVITPENQSEITELWRWLRQSNVEPYFEMITPQGKAVDNDENNPLSSADHRRLFEELADIDRREFQIQWQPQPPLVGHTCLRHQYSCLVNAYGEVMPCVGVTISLGNIRENSLRDILEQSEVLEKLRAFPENIKEPCASCNLSGDCYGCRGAAYQLTGDYLAADPLCWYNEDENIISLPTPAAPWLPHREPILMVDEIVSIEERKGEVRMRVPDAGSLIVDENGEMEAAACIEIAAQAFACIHGFNQGNTRDKDKDGDHKGYLLGAKGFEINEPIRAGELLDVKVRKVGRFGNFGIVEGIIERRGKEITRGELNMYRE